MELPQRTNLALLPTTCTTCGVAIERGEDVSPAGECEQCAYADFIEEQGD